MSKRTRSQAGLGWRARRPLTWQDLMMNPLGVGLNYLSIPSIKDVEEEELKEGGLVQPKKNTQKYHNQYWSIPKRASTDKGDRSVSQALARSKQIQAYSEDTGRSVEDVRAIVGKSLETTFNTDGKVTSTGIATNNANASKNKLLDIPVEPGRTRWVGVNSEWRDRYNNVIAPREGSPAAITTETTTELPKQETKNSGLDPNKLISEGGSKKGPSMTLEDGSINPEWQKTYPQSNEAKIDLIDQGLKTNEQGKLVPWYKGEKLLTRAEFSGDKNTPLQKWQAKELAKIPDEKASSSGPSAGAVMGTIGKLMVQKDQENIKQPEPTNDPNSGSKSAKVANTFKSAIKDPDGWGWYGSLQNTWNA